jgi:hypothetical protein
MSTRSWLARIANQFVRRGEGDYHPGPWFLPVTGGWLPSGVGESANWWQRGFDPIGVCAVTVDGLSMPLIAADEARMKSLIPAARNIARASGRQVKLIKLSQRTELMSISPDGGDMQ